jgi:hypothetical protein
VATQGALSSLRLQLAVGMDAASKKPTTSERLRIESDIGKANV